MPLETNRHLDDEEIEQFSLGQVADDEATRFEEHLLICESCQNRVIETDKYILSMRSASARLRQETAEKQKRNLFVFSRLVPVFAALALILIAVLSVRGNITRLPWYGVRGTDRPIFGVALAAARGNSLAPRVPAGSPLRAELDLTGVTVEGPVRLELVDQLGQVIWQGSVTPAAAKAVASISPLKSGLYFLRAYSSSGTLVREYGLEVAR